jgi:sugar phosphate permease
MFGFGAGFYFLLFVWAANGYVQSMGWPPCVRVTANWIPVLGRGKAIGVIGTGYQVTLGLSYFVAGQSAELLGWRAALYVPAGILVAAAIVMLLFLKESPEDIEEVTPSAKSLLRSQGGLSPGWSLWLTLTNPALWILGASLGLLNACRYGFVDWGIAHLGEVQNIGVGKAALQYVVLAAGAVAGSYLAGWATDRFFGGRRAPVICILLLSLSGLTFLYEAVAQVSAAGTIALLIVIGFCIFGPQVLLVGTAPADLARGGATAAAAGFVNFMGYMGAAVGDKVTGYYKMEEHGGWQVAIYIWAGWAVAAAFFAALLWNAGGNSDGNKAGLTK